MIKSLTVIGLTVIVLLLSIININEVSAAQFHTKAEQAIILESNSNTILFQHNAQQKMSPSSMSKLMTLYVIFSYLKAGIVKMDDKYRVSKEAWQRGGSSMFLREGQLVSVRDLIHGIITVSGNDACITMAEGISGSQENFVAEMNETAKKIGLLSSNFTNVTGWPDPNHVISAEDLVNLSLRIFKDFPEYYHLFAEKTFTYNNINQKNNNNLLLSNIGVDGMKTGHTNTGGYGLTASAEQNGRRIFVVVNGLKSDADRTSEAKRLIQYAFNRFDSKTIIKKDYQIEEAKVWYGKDKTVPITVKDNVTISYSRSAYDKIKVLLSYDSIIPAPIKKGQKVGELHVKIPDMEEKIIPVYAAKDVRQLNRYERLWKTFF